MEKHAKNESFDKSRNRFWSTVAQHNTMNLMDILSNDVAVAVDNEMETVLEKTAKTQNGLSSDGEGSWSSEPMVYFLPTVLCRIQREIMEMLLQIFSTELLSQVQSNVSRTSINSLLDNNLAAPPPEALSTYDKVNLLFDQLRVVTKHPSLMVDHFIPKKLLLSQTNEKLVNLSGNFQLFNRLIDSIVEACRASGVAYTLLVVAQNIKELELIEGVIIGKDLFYNNLSGSKLYESNRQQAQQKVCLNLVTSHQLYNNYITLQARAGVSYNYDAVFSFDLELDVNSPSVELLRSSNHNLPILIPIPVFSLEHIIRQTPKPPMSFYNTQNVSNPVYKWKLRVIHALLMNRDIIWNNREYVESNFFLAHYGRKMNSLKAWLKERKQKQNDQHNSTEEWATQLMAEFDKRLQLDFHKDSLISKVKNNHFAHLQVHKMDEIDYKTFKVSLTQLFYSRLEELEYSVSDVYQKVIPGIRLAQTKRQLVFDQEEDQIAENYHKLRKKNEDAVLVERELAKVDSDVNKLSTKRDDLKKKVEFLTSSTRSDTTSQEQTLNNLREEFAKLKEEYSKLDNDNETVRSNYQTKSSEAVQLTNKVDILKAKSAKASNKLQGPGMISLPSLVRKDVLIEVESDLSVLKNNNSFLSSFLRERLENLTKERHVIIEATSSGSNSRPNNRVSRAGTPL